MHFVSKLLLSSLNPFIKTKSKVPKAVISMKDLNAVFQPEKIGHAHGLQISYLQDERTRNLFVYHENGQVSLTIALALPQLLCNRYRQTL